MNDTLTLEKTLNSLDFKPEPPRYLYLTKKNLSLFVKLGMLSKGTKFGLNGSGLVVKKMKSIKRFSFRDMFHGRHATT